MKSIEKYKLTQYLSENKNPTKQAQPLNVPAARSCVTEFSLKRLRKDNFVFNLKKTFAQNIFFCFVCKFFMHALYKVCSKVNTKGGKITRCILTEPETMRFD